MRTIFILLLITMAVSFDDIGAQLFKRVYAETEQHDHESHNEQDVMNMMKNMTIMKMAHMTIMMEMIMAITMMRMAHMTIMMEMIMAITMMKMAHMTIMMETIMAITKEKTKLQFNLMQQNGQALVQIKFHLKHYISALYLQVV